MFILLLFCGFVKRDFGFVFDFYFSFDQYIEFKIRGILIERNEVLNRNYN